MGWKIYNASLGRALDEQLFSGVCLALDESAQEEVRQEKARLKRALEAAYSGEPLGVFGAPISTWVYSDWDQVLDAVELEDVPDKPVVLNDAQTAALKRLEGEKATLWVHLNSEGFVDEGFSFAGYTNNDGAQLLYLPESGEEL